MTIEQKLKHRYGTCRRPELATWMLRNGDLINGSVEGHQRDIDHREISQFYKHSVREEPGTSTIYVNKFLRRGNIRMICSENAYCCEIAVPPTIEQLKRLHAIMLSSKVNCLPNSLFGSTYVDWITYRGEKRHGCWYDYLHYLSRYGNKYGQYDDFNLEEAQFQAMEG